MEKDKLVYHYTSLRTLFNIIENQSFWLTDLRSSMDKNEMKCAEDLIEEEGKRILGETISQSNYSSASNYYALSCSAYADSYFHFNNYGDNCKGVAIGIDRDFIYKGLSEECCVNLIKYHLYFADLMYDKTKYREEVASYLEYGKEMIEDNNWFSFDQLLADTQNRFFAHLKRKEFALEHEVRLVYRQDYGGFKTNKIKMKNGGVFNLNDFLEERGLEKSTQIGPLRNLKYNYFGNRVRKYYEMSLRAWGLNNIVKSVIIGPKSQQEIDELRDYFESQGLTAEIKKSCIKLRD